jgi:hypothetical protein
MYGMDVWMTLFFLKKSMRGSSCSKKKYFSKTSSNVEITSFICFGGLKKNKKKIKKNKKNKKNKKKIKKK